MGLSRDFDPDMAVVFGAPGVQSQIRKFGRNPAVGTSEEPITPDGQLFFAATPTTLRVAAGGDASDTVAGAGARTIRLVGLNPQFEEQTEDLDLAGASASAATNKSFIRLYRAFVVDAGTYADGGAVNLGANVGDIVIENSGGGQQWMRVANEAGQSQHLAYTVPANKRAVLLGLFMSGSTNQTTEIRIYQRGQADVTAAPVGARRRVSDFVTNTLSEPRVPAPAVFEEKTDIWVTALVTAGADSIVAGTMYIRLEDT